MAERTKRREDPLQGLEAELERRWAAWQEQKSDLPYNDEAFVGALERMIERAQKESPELQQESDWSINGAVNSVDRAIDQVLRDWPEREPLRELWRALENKVHEVKTKDQRRERASGSQSGEP
jgi:hypothetical protein